MLHRIPDTVMVRARQAADSLQKVLEKLVVGAKMGPYFEMRTSNEYGLSVVTGVVQPVSKQGSDIGCWEYWLISLVDNTGAKYHRHLVDLLSAKGAGALFRNAFADIDVPITKPRLSFPKQGLDDYVESGRTIEVADGKPALIISTDDPDEAAWGSVKLEISGECLKVTPEPDRLDYFRTPKRDTIALEVDEMICLDIERGYPVPLGRIVSWNEATKIVAIELDMFAQSIDAVTPVGAWQEWDCPNGIDFDLHGDEMVHCGQTIQCSHCGEEHSVDANLDINTYLEMKDGSSLIVPTPETAEQLAKLRASVEKK